MLGLGSFRSHRDGVRSTAMFSRNIVRSVSEVVDRDLCVSCGACMLGGDRTLKSWGYDRRQARFLPRFDPSMSPGDQQSAFEVCPGKGVPLMGLAERVKSSDAVYDLQLGYVAGACAARTADSSLRENASSGGVITSVAYHLLRTRQVDGVLSTRFAYGRDGPRPETIIVRDLAALLECQGSKYCPVSFHEALERLNETDERIAFIGTPCQIEALRMLQEREPWLRERVRFVIGFFCGGMKDYRELDRLIVRQGMRPADVARFSFRGGGQPGRMTMVDALGRTKTRPYPDYVTDTGFRKLSRCRLCVDGTAELADLACGDAWLPRFLESGHAWSIVITRNQKAARLLGEMVDAGLLMSQPITNEEIRQSQRSNLGSKKLRQLARRRLYRILGRSLPVFDGGYSTKPTSLLFELKVHLRHTLLGWLEGLHCYWPFIRFARWVRRTNEFSTRRRIWRW